jgi:hypothetical protein
MVVETKLNRTNVQGDIRLKALKKVGFSPPILKLLSSGTDHDLQCRSNGDFEKNSLPNQTFALCVVFF